MESRLLEYMLRVGELGSINKAALDLQLSQPALSRHIAALEEEMGTKLFTRTQGGVVPTESGKLLMERARPLLQQLSMLKEELGDAAAGQLTIGVPPYWRIVMTLPFVQTLRATHPKINLRVHERLVDVLRHQMLGGQLDLCILPFDADPPTGFIQTALIREPLILLGGEQEDLDPDTPVPPSRLDGADLILPALSDMVRSQLDHLLRRRGGNFHVVVETDSLGQCLQFARRGIGVTAVPACTLAALSEYGLSESMVRWSPIKGAYITWSLFESQARLHSRAVREGKKLLTKTLQSTIDAGIWKGAQALESLLSAPPAP
jgi:LysR family nitrogen assimilation transcriptional regulator